MNSQIWAQSVKTGLKEGWMKEGGMGVSVCQNNKHEAGFSNLFLFTPPLLSPSISLDKLSFNLLKNRLIFLFVPPLTPFSFTLCPHISPLAFSLSLSLVSFGLRWFPVNSVITGLYGSVEQRITHLTASWTLERKYKCWGFQSHQSYPLEMTISD